MPKVVACIIARTVSKRLPLKVLRDLYPGISMIEFLIQRIRSVKEIDEVYLCTSTESVDDILEDVAVRNNIKIYRGSADEVIERMISVGKIESADIILRITGDNPFTSIEYIPQQISFLVNEDLDYVRIVDIPIGATAEIISFKALEKCYKTIDPAVSEYLMLFLFEPNDYRCGIIKLFEEDFSNYSLTVDTNDDFIRTKGLISASHVGSFTEISLTDIIKIYGDDTVILPAKSFLPSGTIKLPYNKEISVQDFNTDMKRRKQSSKLLRLYE